MTFNLGYKTDETYFHLFFSNVAGSVSSQGNTKSVFLNLIQFSKQKQQPSQLFLQHLEYILVVIPSSWFRAGRRSCHHRHQFSFRILLAT